MKVEEQQALSNDLTELLKRAHPKTEGEQIEQEDGYSYSRNGEEEYRDQSESATKFRKTVLEAFSQEEQQHTTAAWESFSRHYTHERAGFFGFCILILVGLSYWNTFYKEQVHNVGIQEERVTDLRYKVLMTTAELVRLEQINNIEHNIKALGLDLDHSTHPPYKIIDSIAN